MTKVKICGITNTNDAIKAAQLGAWAIGFVFYNKSPRHIGAYKAKKIIDALPPFVTPVGVFVNQKEGAIKDILNFCGITTVQFHGDETPVFCRRFSKYKVIKAIRVGEKFDLATLKEFKVSAFLFDTFQKDVYGGTGESFDWSLIKGAKNLQIPIILSGGLHYNNVRAAIEEVRPYAIDVSSGVETSPGIKNERSMREVFKQVLL